MLLRHRPPGVDTTPVTLQPGLEHLDQRPVAVLRWLVANKIDFVLVGPVAHAIRGELTARGPAAIVPAPYNRNYERLCKALTAQNAGLRSERGLDDSIGVELTPDKLERGKRWLLRFGGHDLDVERPGNGARYQELLYESGRFELTPGFSVEVAALEDLELYSHLRRTGVAPEFRISRAGRPAESPVSDDGGDS